MQPDENQILLLKGREVDELLRGREAEIMLSVERAYRAHERGLTALPHSTFLPFPGERKNRIIALPAYLGDSFDVAGVKWIASFPDNVRRRMDRASAVVILNSTRTGRPEAIIEGSLISAKRTAASAALAARHIHDGHGDDRLGLIGTGVINFEILRFVRATRPGLARCVLFDIDAGRARLFAAKCGAEFPGLEVVAARSAEEVLGECPLTSIATTATVPHLGDLSACRPGSTILHISLRDLTPEAILGCDNIVDDFNHVCQAQTSVHLAEQLVGHRGFLRCTLGAILEGSAPARRDAAGVAVFSPFGLGVLDLALGSLACELARGQNKGTVVEMFLPEPWGAEN